MKTKNHTILSLIPVACLALSSGFLSAAVMYHDLGATTGSESTGNITTHQSGASTVFDGAVDTSTKSLINYSDGTATGVSFSISSIGGTATFDSRNDDQYAPPTAGTPAGNLFLVAGLNLNNGSINMQNGTMTLTFSGLDINTLYDLALFGNRVVTGDGTERFTLGGADAATNLTSTATNSFNDSTFVSRMETRPNDDDVVRWSNINPGADGTFTVTVDPTVTDGTSSTNISYLSAFRLEAIPEPSTALLGVLGMLALLLRRCR